MKNLLVAALGCTLLAACTSNVKVATPAIAPAEFASQSKTPGRYAVYIQTGGWQKEVKAQGWTCSGWSFPTDFESAYAPAARAAFSQSFADVRFVTATLKPDELAARHFDAQIIVYQGAMEANFGVNPGFFTSSMDANVSLEGIVAVTGPDGLQSQGTAKGRGTGLKDTAFTCDAVSPAISNAGAQAIEDFVVDAVNTSKVNVLEMKAKAATAGAAPTS